MEDHPRLSKRPSRSFSLFEKLDAIRRVHAGATKASVGRALGVPESTLRGWCKNERKFLYLAGLTLTPHSSQASSDCSNSAQPAANSTGSLYNGENDYQNGTTFYPYYNQYNASMTETSMATTSMATTSVTTISQLSAGVGSSSDCSTATCANQSQSTSIPLALRSPTGVKAVLDGALYTNSSNYYNYNDEKQEGVLDLSMKTADTEMANQAIWHGRRFTAWLANTSNPEITQWSVRQINDLIEKLTTKTPTRTFKCSRK